MTAPVFDNALYRASQLSGTPKKPGRLGLSRTSLYRLIAAGDFPASIRPSSGIVAWSGSDLNSWLETKASAKVKAAAA